MFQKALSSFDPVSCLKKVSIITLRQHDREFGLNARILASFPQAKIETVDKVTRGPVETALSVERHLNLDDAVVVMDCDLWFSSQKYFQMISESVLGKSLASGGLVYFKSNLPRYSYARLDGDRVLETAEKTVISDHALIGAYYFSSARLFLKAAHQLMKCSLSSEMPEFNVSLLYNYLLKEGQEVRAYSQDSYHSFGTPEELAKYQVREAL